MVKTKQEFILHFKEIFSREPWWAEFWSAIACIGWSIISVISYQPLTDRPALVVLSMIAQPHFWEITGIIIGVFQFIVLMLGPPFGRWAAAFITGWWWFFLTLAIILYDPATPSIALYAVFGAINIFSMVKLARRYA